MVGNILDQKFRKFDGKLFWNVATYKKKKNAKRAVRAEKKRGFKSLRMRITKVKKGGYRVWVRSKN